MNVLPDIWSARVGLARDEQSDHLTLALDDEEGITMQQLQGHSITYPIALGPQTGRIVLTLQTIPDVGVVVYSDQMGWWVVSCLFGDPVGPIWYSALGR